MGFIRDEIIDVAKTMDIPIVELSSVECDIIRRQLRGKFTRGNASLAMWKDLIDKFSVQDVDGWRWVDNFVGQSSTIMLFDLDDEPSMFEFQNGTQVVTILAETFHFEFYLTNHARDYLICFNHHDYLIATGTAAHWLKQWVDGEN